MVKLLQREFGVREIKNRLYDNTAAYASVYVIFFFKGILAELQLVAINEQHNDNDKLRKKVCHSLYEVVRGNGGPMYTLKTKLGPKNSFNIECHYKEYKRVNHFQKVVKK